MPGSSPSDPDEARLQREYLRRVPLRRAGTPRDQAMAVLFLASDDAAWITGQTLIVDGGELGGRRLVRPRRRATRSRDEGSRAATAAA